MVDASPQANVSGNHKKQASIRKFGRHRLKKHVKQVDLEEYVSDDNTDDSDLPVFTMKSSRSSASPIMLPVHVEGKSLQMELNTRSALSVISLQAYQTLLSHIPLKETTVSLKTYTGEVITPKGVLSREGV